MKLAPEGRTIVALLLLVFLATCVAVAGLGLASWWATIVLGPPGLLLLFVAWFFRDPERRVPSDPRALVSPADGRVLRVDGGSLSVFMNVFDVHVCRTPMAGTVALVEHVRGGFLAAWRDAASEHNERAHVVVRGGEHELHVTLVAGLVARRIVCRARPGQNWSPDSGSG